MEFPIVALAGFGAGNYPHFSAEATEEQKHETLARERRVMFVGMTRAMRTLLVNTNSPLLSGFDPTYWSIGGK